MRLWKHMPGGLPLGFFTLLIVAIGVLPAACARDTDLGEASLCFTPYSEQVGIAQSVQLVVTITFSGGRGDRKLNEEGGWLWVWESDDGGKIDFSQEQVQWSGGPQIYMATAHCTAREAGKVTVMLREPPDEFPLAFEADSDYCKSTCTIAISTAPVIW